MQTLGHSVPRGDFCCSKHYGAQPPKGSASIKALPGIGPMIDIACHRLHVCGRCAFVDSTCAVLRSPANVSAMQNGEAAIAISVNARSGAADMDVLYSFCSI